MRALLLCVALFALGVGSAAAQTPSLGEQFQIYQDALQRGDLAAAEAAAAAALAASEQRDGDGGNTAVLAHNLARVRAQLGRWQDAAAPARRAYDLARRQGQAGRLDPVMAELLWGRVRVANEGLDGAGALENALERAASRDDLIGDRYDAADQLGSWAMANHRYIIARGAWMRAAEAALGAPYDAAFARGRAKTYQGIAIALQSFTREVVLPRLVVRDVRNLLLEAHPLVQPFAMADGQDGAFTHPQEVYANLLVWDAAVWSKARSDDPSRRSDPILAPNPQTTIDGAPICDVRSRTGAGVSFPVTQRYQGQLGAVVVRMRFREDGTLLSADVAASVGDAAFEREVAGMLPNAAFYADMQSTTGCKAPRVYFVPVTFYFASE